MKKREHTTKCGICGKHGHNKRTCGKKPNPIGGRAYTEVQPNKTLPEVKTSPTPVSDVYSKLHDNKTPPVTTHDVKKGTVLNVNPTAGYTAEDLETLWYIKDGNFGKASPKRTRRRGNIWSEESAHALNEMVENLEKGESGIEVKEWVKFFKHFGAEAKTTLLISAAKAPSVTTPTYVEMLEVADEILYQHTKNNTPPLTKHVLHIKIFEALSKDASPSVRSTLAGKEGLPDHIKKIMLDDQHTSVVLNLAKRVDTSTAQLTYLKYRVDNRVGFAKNGYIMWDVEEIYKHIATHPNTSPEVVKSFFTHPPLSHVNDTSPFITMFAAGHKNAPTRMVESCCQEILQKRNTKKQGDPYDTQWDAAFVGNASRYHLKREQINEFLSLYFQETFPTESVLYHHERGVGLALMSDKLTAEDVEKYYHKMRRTHMDECKPAALGLFLNPNLPTSVAEHYLNSLKEQPHSKRVNNNKTSRVELLAKRKMLLEQKI